MMIFTVYDSKTSAYMTPFFMQTKPAAIRALADAVNNPEHGFQKHSEDYSLFYLGEFDDVDASIASTTTPIHLCGLHELKSAHTIQPVLADPTDKEISNG